MILSNKAYDILKWIAMIVIPALGALYFGLSSIWGLPYGTEIEGTCALLTTFLSTILMISNKNYKNSLNEIDEEESNK